MNLLSLINKVTKCLGTQVVPLQSKAEGITCCLKQNLNYNEERGE